MSGNVVDFEAYRNRQPDIHVLLVPYWDESVHETDYNYRPMLNYDRECGWVLTFFGEDLSDPRWCETRIFAPDHIHDPLEDCHEDWTGPWDDLVEWAASNPVELKQALAVCREHLKGFVQTRDAETGRPIFERPEGYIEPDYDG